VPLLPTWARWALVGVVAAVIFYASVLVVPAGGPDTGPIGVDKLYHAGGYFVLGLTVAYALLDADRPRSVRLALVFLAPVAFGVGVEIAQALVPARAFDPIDALANAVGAAAASSICAIRSDGTRTSD